MESTAVSLDLQRPKAHLLLKVLYGPLNTAQNILIVHCLIKTIERLKASHKATVLECF